MRDPATRAANGPSRREKAHLSQRIPTAIDDRSLRAGGNANRRTVRENRREAAPAVRRAAAQERVSSFLERPRMRTDEWAGLLASGSAYLPHLPASQRRDGSRIHETVAICGFRPRLQRRDRDGFAPFSLFFTPGAEPRVTPMSAAILTRAERLSTQEIEDRLGEFLAGRRFVRPADRSSQPVVDRAAEA